MSRGMTLNNFEDYFEPTILARGSVYFDDGNVLNITLNGSQYVAKVVGSELYTVSVTLDADGRILATCCDCPYDYGDYCKHQAAVLFALREQVEDIPHAPTDGKPEHKQLLAALQAKSKDELVGLIMSLVKEDSALEARLAFEYGEAGDSIAEAKKLMQRYIWQASKDEWVRLDDVWLATKGIDIVLDRAANHPAPLVALQLYCAVMAEAMDLLQMADDSEGGVGDCIWSAIHGIGEIVDDSAATLSRLDRREAFNLILKEANRRAYDGWEWREELLSACIPLCELPDCRQQLEQYLESVLSKIPNTERQDNYRITALKLIQLSIIEQFDGEQAARDFIEQNVVYSDFRKQALELAMQARDYSRVLELTQSGIETDAEWAGLVRQWEKYAFAAYRELDDVDNMRRLARKFVMSNNYDYYQQLKGMYTEIEWPATLIELLTDMEQHPYRREAYIRILVEENLQDRLMAHCEQSPAEIISLYQHFDSIYATQVNDLFLAALRDSARRASNRSHYRQVCHQIRAYHQACGTKNAARLVHELRASYRRRPAFLDELRKLSV